MCELVFPSAQRADVELLRQGTVAYRWSDERAFAAVETAVQIAPGGRFELALDDVLEVSPGEYVLRATAASSPALPSAAMRLVVRA